MRANELGLLSEQEETSLFRIDFLENLQKRKEWLSFSLSRLLSLMQQTCLDTYEHCIPVYNLTRMFAHSLAFSGREIQSITQAALFHDVGKVAIPDAILNKPGALIPLEFEQMKLHSTLGARLLLWASTSREIASLVRHHHERWDGSGYPCGLKGNAIPLGARLIALSDAFDAMTSPRSYQQTHTSTQTLAEFYRCAGTHFDPVLVDRFCAMIIEDEKCHLQAS